LQRETGLVIIGLRDGIRLHQRGVAIIIHLIEVNLCLLGVDVALHPAIILFHRLDRQPGLRKVGLGIVERDLELARIELIEHLSGIDVLVFGHVDLLHNAGDVGRETDLVSVNVSVVGRHHLAAGHIPIGAGEQDDGQKRKKPPTHQPPATRTARGRAVSGRRLPFRPLGCGFLFGARGLASVRAPSNRAIHPSLITIRLRLRHAVIATLRRTLG